MNNQSGSGKIFAFIFLIIAVTAAIFFFFQRQKLQKQTKDLLDKANKLATTKLPDPTPSYYVDQTSKGFNIPTVSSTPAPTATPTPILTPVTSEKDQSKSTTKETADSKTKGGIETTKSTIAKKITTKTVTVCTPVYGMANSCAEHIVVDTALDTSIFTNMALLSYVGGLVAFVKAKRK